MPKCWKCSKSGDFLAVSQVGLCIDCLEEAADGAIKFIEMIKKGGTERQKALRIIDGMVLQDGIQQVQEKLEQSPFAVWDKSIHLQEGQYDRIQRSKKVIISNFDLGTQKATIKGTKGATYETAFASCTCGDFVRRRLPCKHMYKLAEQYGGVNFLTE